MMGSLATDVRYGIRMLRKNPGFAAVAVITLGLGIGANTAIFSVVNGVLLNPLPYAQPDRLVALYSKTHDFERSSISYPNFLDWLRDNRSFSSIAGYRTDDFTLTGMGDPERVPVEMVSASFFSTLGVRPAMGRDFLPSDDLVGAAPVALASGGFWKRKLGAARDTVGKAITLNGKAYTIVGVLPASFRYTENNFHPSDLYVPIGQWDDPTFRNRAVGMGMNAVGRLKPGVTFGQANDDMKGVGRHLAEAFPDTNKDTSVTLRPLIQDVVGEIRPFLLVLMAAVGFVLLIACVNVANLMLARSTARVREFAIRSSLGASPGRAIRQLMTESILLGLAGGGLGLLLASWGLKGALRMLPEALPRAEDIHLDTRVLLFTLAASLVAGALFGLVPALKTSVADLHETLKEGGRGASAVRHRAQSVFVVVEMALALVLLAGAGLMIRSLAKLWKTDPGFDPHHVLTLDTSAPPLGSPAAVRESWLRIHDEIESLPGVEAASMGAGSLVMGGSDSEVPFWIEGQPKPATEAQMPSSLLYLVQPDYFKVMRIPLRRGRYLTLQDNQNSPLVALIDDKFARLYFGNDNPIGKRFNFEVLNTSVEIVGVVGHVKQWGLDEDASSPVQAQLYFPLSQVPDKFLPLLTNGTGAVLRSSGSPPGEDAIRRALGRVNGLMTVYNVETMDGMIADSLAARRFAMTLLGIFAALALVMACVGIYGVVSYLAGQRTHEIGVRMALGAERSDVLRMMLREAAQMALIGIAIGLATSIGLTRLMAKMLFGISPHDPLTLVGVAAVLAAVALAACYIPARPAASVDPLVALRYE